MKYPQVVTIPDPILRQTLAPVTDFTQELRDLAAVMIEVMHRAEGVGLAANQIGDSTRLFVYGFDEFELDGKKQQAARPQAVVNPEIEILDSTLEVMSEGCLSIPGLTGPVARPAGVRLRGFDVQGRAFTRDLRGYEARVVQHETDHLNGKLYLDYITDPTKLRREQE